MHRDQSGLHLALFAAALAIALFGWVELSLTTLGGTTKGRPEAHALAPGLSIAVMPTDKRAISPQPIRDLAYNEGDQLSR